MATIRVIDALNPIEGADAIECATIGGWKVVVKKGEFAVGDRAVYCEIDSWIPTEIASFLSKGKEPRVYYGIQGERLRTVSLRKTVSQGLLLPLKKVE
jgi:RNA ligase (TIGR02306 family)